MSIRSLSRTFLAAASILYSLAAPASAQAPCPPEAVREVARGWEVYRLDSVGVALGLFASADRRCLRNWDAKTGLGYARLRLDELNRADSLFTIVTRNDSLSADAWTGLALVASRLGQTGRATASARRALAMQPENSTARGVLDRVAPDWDRTVPGPQPRPDTLQLVARTRGSAFEVNKAGRWTQFYIKGINLGVALPGRFPAEFPTDSTLYAGWLDTIGTMRANTVRVYTILPPEFYRALRGYNLTHPDAPLWLVHGVWTELPPDDDFENPAWKAGFRAEMSRIVHLVHGNAALEPGPGHASGRYDADVSRWTLAWIIGREWEPFAVKAFDSIAGGPRHYDGRYLAMTGPATDAWMAEQCDYMLALEMDRYHAIRPIAYTNWPTLDPLTHPTESTVKEEMAWRRRTGRPFLNPSNEYDNDVIGLDPGIVHPTPANPAGWFASYHAYPYYPDFMLFDSTYGAAASSEGPSNYYGYLRDLVRYHKDMPVVIAEYGVPSSRGEAHWQPQGWNHGGHDEAAMARIDARLTRDIHEAGAAGSILFAWIDEWFKRNWVVVDLQIPASHTPRWHNAEDAEQNYGVLGMYAGQADSTPALGGNPCRWKDPAAPGAVSLRSDEAYVYVSVPVDGLDWDSSGVMIALDTYRPAIGQHQLPHTGTRTGPGFEFLVDLRRPDDAQLRIISNYDPLRGPPPADGDERGQFYHRPAATRDRTDGAFDSMYVITNRARFGRDGTFYPARGYVRGRLRYGTASQSSLSDWYHEQKGSLLEIRLPWQLLNVTDPSTRTVLDDESRDGPFGTTHTDGFRVGAMIYRKADGQVQKAFPALRNDEWRAEDFRTWAWKTWEMPTYHERLKPVYGTMRETWGELP